MAYDFILFNRDNLNGSEEEIIYKKKKIVNPHSKGGAETRASW